MSKLSLVSSFRRLDQAGTTNLKGEMIKPQDILEKARQLVGQNQLEEALQNIILVINEISNKEELLNDITNIQGRIKALKKSELNGVLSAEEKERSENKLRSAILGLIVDTEENTIKAISKTDAPLNPDKSKKFPFAINSALIFSVLFIAVAYYLYQMNVQQSNMDFQEDIIRRSNLIVFLKNDSKWDTLQVAEDILKVATCQLSDELFTVKFDISHHEILECEDLKFQLNHSFMKGLTRWPRYVENWDKEYSSNSFIYTPLSPCQKDKFLFKANLIKN